MWIVRIALTRPYTFIVLALVLLIGRWRSTTDPPRHRHPVSPSSGTMAALADDVRASSTERSRRRRTTSSIEPQSRSGVGLIGVLPAVGEDRRRRRGRHHAATQLAADNAAVVIVHNASACRSCWRFRQSRSRAAARLRLQLHPHAAGDGAGRRDPLP
jgi:hypothetical protein